MLGRRDLHSSYRSNSNQRKRKRWEPTVSRASYGENTLVLEDLKTPNQSTSVEESKVINSLKRLEPKVKVDKSKDFLVNISIAESERHIFELDEIYALLKNELEVSDISISSGFNGAILSIYGDVKSISRGAVFISYVLNTQANNFVQYESFTLKSNNYKLYLLFENIKEEDMVEVLENTGLYNYDVGFDSVTSIMEIRVKSDFHSLFSCLVAILMTFPKPAPLGKIEFCRKLVSFDEAVLFKRSNEDKELLQKLANLVLKYVYNE